MIPFLNLRSTGQSLLVLAFLFLSVQEVAAQSPLPRDTIVAAARQIMETARYCGLVTLDVSGKPRVRTMDPFAPEADMTVWFGTKRGTRKIHEIENDSRVTLYYQAPDGGGYVTISGRAHLIDDPSEKASRWKEDWEAFYADRAADYVLIQVVPDRLEVIHYARGISGDPESWQPAAVQFRGG